MRSLQKTFNKVRNAAPTVTQFFRVIFGVEATRFDRETSMQRVVENHESPSREALDGFGGGQPSYLFS